MKPFRRGQTPLDRPSDGEPGGTSDSPPNPGRRRLLRWGVRLALAAPLAFGFWRRQRVRIDRATVPVPNLPAEFRGFRIAQISDLHASFWAPRDFLDSVVAQVNRLNADLIAVTGDFITGGGDQLWGDTRDIDYGHEVAEALARLRGKHRFGVLGNHDQGKGERETRRLVDRLESAGLPILRNRATVLRRGAARLYLAGTDDFWHQGDVGAALRDVPETGPTLLLTHNPDAVADIPDHRRVALTLCGHTHGGQVVVPFLTRRVLPIREPHRYMAGLVRESHGHTYVNRGIGTLLLPFRLGAPPEITEITLA
jgi:hypothetical protein